MSDDPTNIIRRSKHSRPESARGGSAGTIRFLCPNSHQIVVPVKLAGKRGSCSRCGAPVVIPAAPVVSSQQPTESVSPAGEAAGEELRIEAPPEEMAESAPAIELPTGDEAAEEAPDFSGIGGEGSAEPAAEASVDAGLFEGIAVAAGEPAASSFAGVEASEEPEIDGVDNPTAVLVAKLFAECAADSVIELHLKSGQIVMPLLFDFKWSRGTHGVFATPNKSDDTVTLQAVSWDCVEQVIVRKVPGLPDGMFE